jgi:hypothetical protein
MGVDWLLQPAARCDDLQPLRLPLPVLMGWTETHTTTNVHVK